MNDLPSNETHRRRGFASQDKPASEQNTSVARQRDTFPERKRTGYRGWDAPGAVWSGIRGDDVAYELFSFHHSVMISRRGGQCFVLVLRDTKGI